ncbi:MAG: 3-hydroxyacyl-CoA dehydrogenase family protein [Bacteroidota bacterium]
MILAIAANRDQKLALEQKGFGETIEIEWFASSASLYEQNNSHALIDCLFSESVVPETGKPLLIHSPVATLEELKAPGNTARFCAWNSFIERPVWEIALSDQSNNLWIQDLMAITGWQYQLVKDEPGLLAPRVISMIINEAYFALNEGISDKEDINTAMRLGTNYPYGPFEWAEKIGVKNIHGLLTKLSQTDKRYEPSGLLAAGY